MAKSTDYPQSVREFGVAISSFSYKYYDYDIFADFIDYVIACLLWKGSPETAERLKKKYGDEYSKFLELYRGFLMCQKKNLAGDESFEWYDVLGEIYETISSGSKASWLGQFFTPKHICDLMAQVTVPINGEEMYESKEVLRVNDCASGSGRTLLAFNKEYPGQELYADDLDPICSKMSAINLALHGCKGQVCNMNSLMPDDWYFGYQINPWQNMLNGFPHIIPIQKEQSFSYSHWQDFKVEKAVEKVEQEQEEKKSKKPTKAELRQSQLTLF
jgi:type I restriction enzyme M protein